MEKENMMNDSTMKMEHSINFRWLLAFAMPTIISTIFMNVYTAVDGVFVARFVNTDALSAINITLPSSLQREEKSSSIS